MTSLTERVGQPGMSPCPAASQGLDGLRVRLLSQKVVWLCVGFQIRSWRLVVSMYSASVPDKSVFYVNLCVLLYVCNAGCTNW